MNTDQIAAEAAKQIRGQIVDRTGVSLDHRDTWIESIIKAAIGKATEQKDEALLRIFDWAIRNKPYSDVCKIEGNTLLQDICEQGLGYLPESRAAHASEADG